MMKEEFKEVQERFEIAGMMHVALRVISRLESRARASDDKTMYERCLTLEDICKEVQAILRA